MILATVYFPVPSFPLSFISVPCLTAFHRFPDRAGFCLCWSLCLSLCQAASCTYNWGLSSDIASWWSLPWPSHSSVFLHSIYHHTILSSLFAYSSWSRPHSTWAWAVWKPGSCWLCLPLLVLRTGIAIQLLWWQTPILIYHVCQTLVYFFTENFFNEQFQDTHK